MFRDIENMCMCVQNIRISIWEKWVGNEAFLVLLFVCLPKKKKPYWVKMGIYVSQYKDFGVLKHNTSKIGFFLGSQSCGEYLEGSLC